MYDTEKTERKKCTRKKNIEFSLVFYKNSVATKVEIRRCTNQNSDRNLHDYTKV